ncbi:MAG TPA: zinc metallopeptidase [Phycisphaerae bacterium]|nr:zinc metallopeptidase [Phycisphaerae bacterium]
MYFGLDPLYYLLLIPPMLLAAWAQYRVKSTFTAAAKYRPMSGMSGVETAQRILDVNGMREVKIEPVAGNLSDHYDPRTKTLRLSQPVYSGRSLAAIGIAAHEVGHALQDKKGYAPLKLRNGIVPLASVGSNLSMIIFMAGMFMSWGRKSSFGMGLMLAGIVMFSAVVLFQLINLPVEFDASNRAKRIIVEQGFVSIEERQAVDKVLNAAALTYVAATLSAIMTLVYLLIRSGLLGGRRD